MAEIITSLKNFFGNTIGIPSRRPLTRPEAELINLVGRKDELTIKEIASAMFLERDKAALMVKKLMRRGFLDRIEWAYEPLVKLSTEGMRRFEQGRKRTFSHVSDIITTWRNSELDYSKQP